MLNALKALAGPDGVEQTRRRMFGLARRAGRSPAQPADVVSDEQIIALVAGARALGQRQRRRNAAVTSVEARERLLRLDWAVRTGRLVLAERAGARALAFGRLPPPLGGRTGESTVTRLPALGEQRAMPTAAPGARLDLSALLDAVEAAPPAEGVDALAAELAARLCASEVSMLIVDISGRTLARLARRPAPGRFLPRRPAREHVDIDGTPAGAALTTQRIHVSRDEDGVWVHVPVSERGEALGVLELLVPDEPDAQILNYLRSAGHALAYVIIADRRFSDLYELGQRSTVLTLEAEIQRRLLPASFACEGPQFALAGWLVPADEAGGDTFDYMVGRDTLHLSITDAMGHGLAAAQLATLGVASLRNSRRRGLGLTDQARQASRHIATHADADQFVTALLGRIDLQTGAMELVNAGHMNPLLVRDRQVSEIALNAGLVLGVAIDEAYDVQRFQLQPGDRLALVTDGMSERDAAEAEIEKLLGTLGHLHPRETVQVLTEAVLGVTAGAVRDDATVLVVDWYGASHTAPA